MVHAINVETQYGKQGTTGINVMPELSGDSIVYAVSMEQAIAWVKKQNLFAESEHHSLGDGRIRVESKWMDNDYSYLLYGHEDAKYTRQVLTIYPVNTVFENTGYIGTAGEIALPPPSGTIGPGASIKSNLCPRLSWNYPD